MKAISVLILLLLSTFSYGQQQMNFYANISKPEFHPPSPEASSLGKFGQYEVSMSTGVPEISLPIYTIQLKDFSFPISLLYNASGIKMSEIGSRVGMGWALNLYN